MAGRPPKTGLEFFPLDVIFDDDIELIEAECGLDGLAILIKLWQKIYHLGYYIKWASDIELLFEKKINADKNKVSTVLNACFRRNLLSKKLYEEYGILTGRGLQKRYLSAAATAKRVYIPFDRRYLLLSESCYLKLVTEWIVEESAELILEEIHNYSGIITEETPISPPLKGNKTERKRKR